MSKSFRDWHVDQQLLLPPAVQDFVGEEHLARFVISLTREELDLTAIYASYGGEKGQPPYHPGRMTALLLYGYAVGIYSSRRLAKACLERVDFMAIAALDRPDFRTVSDFRKRHLPALEGLFEQVLKIALEAGAMKVGRVALDGTKMKANASKHKAMSYGRMGEKEKELRGEVKELLAQAEAVDAAEDARHGKRQRGDELPEELARRESRLKKIREAKRALEERAREQAVAAGGEANQARPKDKDQYHFTDPESRIMKGADGFLQGYNAQAAVEPILQLIVGQTVTAAGNDKQQLVPMLEVIEQQSGQRPTAVLADSGYCSEKNLEALESADRPEQRIEIHTSPRSPPGS
jgi:transposase